VKQKGLTTVALLATAYTMEQDFYINRLKQHNLQVIIPNADDRKEVHRIIYEELCHGKILHQSRETYQRIINDLKLKGAQGVILGCTEISMLIHPEDVDIPTFDTTEIHATKAVDIALSD